MNDIEVSSIDLVEGGNVFKQGHYLTLGYIPRDENGNAVDLSGKNITVTLWERDGIAFESAATYSGGVLRFTLNETVPAGNYQIEFTATSSTDEKYRKKFPTNYNSGRISVQQSADDAGNLGISVYTVAQIKSEQQAAQVAYQEAIDPKITTLTKRVDDGVGAFTEDTEVIDARMGKANLRQFNEGLTAQLADNQIEVASLNLRNEGTKSPKQYGAMGNGIVDDSQAIIEALQTGGVLLGEGDFYIGVNGTVTIEGKENLIIEGNKIAKIFNNTKTADSGGMLRLLNCKNILFKNFGMFCDTDHHGAYDNALVIENASNIVLEDMDFSRTSNKHIHIEGIVRNIILSRCIFDSAHFNTNHTVDPAFFGAVHIHFESEAETDISGILFEECSFSNIPSFAISVNNVNNHTQTKKSIRDIVVKNCSFFRCGGVVYGRSDTIKFVNNKVVECGSRNIDAFYRWIPSLNRYFSKHRENKGIIPSASNTVRFNTMPLFYMDSATHYKIEDNEITKCMETLNNPNMPFSITTDAYWVRSRLTKHGKFSRNTINEESALSYPDANAIRLGFSAEEVKFNQIEDNTFILNPILTLPQRLIRSDIPANTMRNNKLYGAPSNMLYHSTLKERVVIHQNGKYYELLINASGVLSAVEVVAGTDF